MRTPNGLRIEPNGTASEFFGETNIGFPSANTVRPLKNLNIAPLTLINPNRGPQVQWFLPTY